MNVLDIWWDGHLVGQLSPSPTNQLRFTYDQTWLSLPTAQPLSRSLPLGTASQKEAQGTAFFAGLLPEERIRQQVAANLGISESNHFALLSALGEDCAGALQILEKGREGSAPEHPAELDLGTLAAHVHRLPRNPLLAGEEGVRLSLAGAQAKLPVIKKQDRWFLSNAKSPSTHILKPEPEDYPGLVAVEAFCLDLARSVGISTVEAEELDLDGLPVLCVQRYDREEDDKGCMNRIHQEDLCQSLGIPPHRKYQQEGGPSALDFITCIREWSTIPVLDLNQTLDLFVFNIIIGNADAHGKNFSWLYKDKTRRLAPAYDLISTTLWPELSPRMAMRIGQAKFISEVTLDHLLIFGKQAGLGIPPMKKRIHTLLERIQQQINPVLERHPALLDEHRDRLRHQLPERMKKIQHSIEPLGIGP